MFDWDAVIIGGGPAGLTAGLYLSRARRRTLLLDKDTPGGYLRNIELIENYPSFAKGIAGAELASQMVAQAVRFGLQIENAEVTGIELFSGTRYVNCADGRGYTTGVIVIAGGSKNKKLGVPGEAELLGKGVFECALCDGGRFAGKTVAVCGGGDSGLTEALYMANIASSVTVIEFMPELNATAILQDRVKANNKISVITGAKVQAVDGRDKVEGVALLKDGKSQTLKVDGVLVHIGTEPDTEWLEGIITRDKQGYIVVDGNMQTEDPHVFAAGDVRSVSPRQVVTAAGDGAIAGVMANRVLEEEG